MQVRHNPAAELENVMLAVRKGVTAPSRNRLTADDVVLYRTDKDYHDEDFLDDLISDKAEQVFQRMGDRIKYLRQRDFDYYYKDAGGKTVLVKNNLGKSFEELNPIHPDESEIQFLRYMRGMLLMAQNIGNKEQRGNLMVAAVDVYQIYMTKKNNVKDSPKLVQELAGELLNRVKAIEWLKDDKHAGMQLTMARDLASMLETHPDVCTVANMSGSKKVSVSKSSMQKVSADYYERFFDDLEQQAWVQSAKALQGHNTNASDWLSHCLQEKKEEMKLNGNPAVPSARWLPLPATYFHEEKITFHDGRPEYNDYLRTGVMIPFDVKKAPALKTADIYVYQKEIAIQIAKEILRAQVPRNIQHFRNMYQIPAGQEFPFYVNYQTLLSPLLGEGGFKHTDNNARFVKLVGDVFHALQKDEAFMHELAGKSGAQIKLTHTNSAINRNAWLTSSAMAERVKKFKNLFSSAGLEDTAHNAIRRERLESARNFVEANIHNITDEGALLETSLRMTAANYLEALLNNEGVYAKMETYQKNLMMAALDHLVIGAQGVSIDGCKSCRDRTEVFGAAVKVMKENPEAMSNWSILEKGIVDALMQGHGFRSVGFHVAAVKASLVHKRFSEGLSESVQKAIKAYTPFSKALKEVDQEEQQEVELEKEFKSAGVRSSSSGLFGRTKRSASEPRVHKKSLEEAHEENEKGSRKRSDPGPSKRE